MPLRPSPTAIRSPAYLLTAIRGSMPYLLKVFFALYLLTQILEM